MQKWKFLLLGITGHLSATKILPALAQFAEMNQAEVSIDLIGFARSMPDTAKIEEILNQNSSGGKHFLASINYLQGQYDDPNYFYDIVSGLEENQKLIAYLAVPPSVFINFLKNSCAYTEKDFEIIMEKPFGNSLQEAQEIFRVIETCSMGGKVHFFDHYMFKTATLLTAADKLNFKALETKQVWQLTVKALETDGVAGRAGYYDTAGAFKDMLPHLLSLANFSFELIGKNRFEQAIGKTRSQNPTKNLVQNTSQNSSQNAISYIDGQYQEYKIEVQNPNSTTDTYFKLALSLEMEPETEKDSESSSQSKPQYKLVLESGKKLAKKTTNLQILFTDGASLSWQIAPEKKLILEDGDNSFEINLDKDNKLDHTNMFEALLVQDYTRFVSPSLILAGWGLFEEISKMEKSENNGKEAVEELSKNPNVKLYVSGKYPVEFIEE